MTDKHIPEPTFDLDADTYTPEQLESYFEPNTNVYELDEQGMEILKDGENCAYDRLAGFRDAYILYAERGVGKTHLLNLLGEQIKKRGGVFLSINPEDPGSPLRAFQELRNRYSNASPELVYKYILMEALNERLSFFLRHQAHKVRQKIAQAFDSVSVTIKLKLPYIDVEQTKEKIQVSRELSLSNETSQIQKRVERMIHHISKSKVKNGTRASSRQPLYLRNLPDTQCVYVIIDKLDQAEKNPGLVLTDTQYQQKIIETLVSLVDAVKYFNSKARKDNINLKIILSLRAITFHKAVKEHLSNQTQYENMIIPLKWTSDAIERMITRRILFGKEIKTHNERESLINSRLPELVHYFGREVPTLKLLSEIADNRPRRIMSIWQKSVSINYPGKASKPFDIPLTERDIVRGIQEYSRNNVLDDISQEHELDYPNIKKLMQHLADNHDVIPRLPQKQVLLDEIGKFKNAEKSYFEKTGNEWYFLEPEAILQILYEIGIIGFLSKMVDPSKSWPEDEIIKYAGKAPDEKVKNYDQMIISPILWHKLTNIDDEIRDRRRLLEKLYDDLENQLSDVDMQIQALTNDGVIELSKFEFAFAKFFVITKLIRETYNYPEPADWAKWDLVDEKIENSWIAFAESVLSDSTDRMFHIKEVGDLATFAHQYVIKVKSSDGVLYSNHDEFKEFAKSSEYNDAYQKIQTYPKSRKHRTAHALRRFREILVEGRVTASLHGVLQMDYDSAFKEKQNA